MPCFFRFRSLSGSSFRIWRIPMSKDIIIIDGVRYHSDRPSSCRGCYFWKNRKVGCTLGKENCYYLAESPKKKSPCEGCCYGPCVSFCMKKILGFKGEWTGTRSRPDAGSVPIISRTSGTAGASSLPAPMGKTETPPSEESRFGRRKSSARRWVV